MSVIVILEAGVKVREESRLLSQYPPERTKGFINIHIYTENVLIRRV